MSASPLLDRLIEALRCLPGVGPKSAQRMAFHILERNRDGAHNLAEALTQAANRIGHCKRCRTLSEEDICRTCADTARDAGKLCVVESPADVFALDHATGFTGYYFVLMGRLSPLDGIGPAELGLELLARRLAEGQVKELIIATNPTVEGEATAHYLSQMAHEAEVSPTRIAHGVPIGGELEYTDSNTLAHAFSDRKSI